MATKAIIARINALETHTRRPAIFLVDEAEIGHEAARAEIAKIEKDSARIGVEPIIIVF